MVRETVILDTVSQSSSIRWEYEACIYYCLHNAISTTATCII